MTGFIIRRLGQAIIVVLGVTLITFMLLHLLVLRQGLGQVAREILGNNRVTPQALAVFEHQTHLDKPFITQYLDFLGQLITGSCPSGISGTCHFGYSYQFNRTVDAILVNDLPRDVVLGGFSLIFSLIIAIPVGIAQAVRRNGALDYAGTGISFLLYSMPQYAIALLLIQFLSISFHVFPATVAQSTSGFGILAHPSGLVLPILSLTLVTFAAFSRYMRSSAIDTLAQDYIRTARAKGLPERLVLWRHLLRNSLVAVVTLVGLSIPLVLTGTLIIEQVFNLPGAGLEYFQATLRNDYEVMIGITVLVGVITVLGNLIADIGYAILDPRIRY
ncbi:MAG TPA: ABC transporter permease [Solirubrobacteraceae bacterium]|jgi:peptide/nickel transport system permease protein|nr:ABC transporter permease [Solirubrobacteraceae bacterium]